jgi:hypothetical protein
MEGRNILDEIAMVHQSVHKLHPRKLNGVILKIDFENGFNKIKWSFLQQTLGMKGFFEEFVCFNP